MMDLPQAQTGGARDLDLPMARGGHPEGGIDLPTPMDADGGSDLPAAKASSHSIPLGDGDDLSGWGAEEGELPTPALGDTSGASALSIEGLDLGNLDRIHEHLEEMVRPVGRAAAGSRSGADLIE